MIDMETQRPCPRAHGDVGWDKNAGVGVTVTNYKRTEDSEDEESHPALWEVGVEIATAATTPCGRTFELGSKFGEELAWKMGKMSSRIKKQPEKVQMGEYRACLCGRREGAEGQWEVCLEGGLEC